MKGSRSSNNCYMLLHSLTSHKTSVNDIELWHQKLGHLNYKNLTKIVSTGVVRGVPKLGEKQPGICGPCHFGKQVKVSHKVLQYINTTRVIELLHIDLMGPIYVESIVGKRYVFVFVNDF